MHEASMGGWHAKAGVHKWQRQDRSEANQVKKGQTYVVCGP